MRPAQLLSIASHFAAARWRAAVLRGPALARYQDDRARRITAWTAAHSPYYRAHWAGHDLADWRSLPTVDKAAMMANFDGFNTRGVSGEAAMAVALRAETERDFSPSLDGLTVGLSSGTSGHRGLFLVSKAEQAAWAGLVLARVLDRLSPQRVAFFLRSNSNLYESVGGALITFRYFDLMTPPAEAAAALNAFGPDILAGPPSLLGLLAAERRAGRLRAAPRRLISVAEVLEPGDRAALEAAFDAPVGEIYQCTEGLLAISCARGRLHVQEDVAALQFEPLDDGRVSPIVTDLHRTTQPIIRYRLNDVLRLDTRPCPCGLGFGVIAAIEGRCDDVFYFESQDGGLRPFFPDVIRRMVLLASGDIEDYQAYQDGPGRLRLHLRARPGTAFDAAAQAVRTAVDSTVAGYNCRPARLQIEPGLPPAPARAKRRRVQRLG